MNFPEDVTDGTLLANFYEIVSNKSIGKLDKSKFDVQKVSNVSKVFSAFDEEGVKVKTKKDIHVVIQRSTTT